LTARSTYGRMLSAVSPMRSFVFAMRFAFRSLVEPLYPSAAPD
jgi:hypothetical protein